MRLAIAVATLVAAAAFAKEFLPESGPLPRNTMQRLLVVDATLAGKRLVAVGDRGYIVTSDDNGASWKRAMAPAAPLLTAVTFIDDKHGWAVGHDAMILATADGGETWTKQFSAVEEQRPLLGIHFLDAKHGYAVGAYGAFYETTDGGAKWTARKILADDKHLNAIIEAGKDTLVIFGEAGTLLRSTDAGATWQPVPAPYKGSFFGGVMAKDGAIVAFGLRGRIYRSTDAGKSWTQVPSVSEFTLMNGTLMPDGAIVLAGAAGTLLSSRDNGQSFTAIPSGRRGAISKALPGPGTILLMTDAGVREAGTTGITGAAPSGTASK
jgi:photosystem II stability/assembly factor-like uncharacterized protein